MASPLPVGPKWHLKNSNNGLNWKEWVRLFWSGKTPATYLSIITVLVFTISVYINREATPTRFILTLAGLIMAYGNFTDQVSHLLWLHGYANMRLITKTEYIHMFFTLRQHVNLGFILIAGILIYLGGYYLAVIPVVIADIILMVNVRYYH